MLLDEELKNKSVAELKTYAKNNNISLKGATTKAEILKVCLNNKTEDIVAKIETPEKVAIYTERNLFWNGLGTIDKGYNIVSKEASEKWITHKAVRLATPEEVASYYRK